MGGDGIDINWSWLAEGWKMLECLPDPMTAAAASSSTRWRSYLERLRWVCSSTAAETASRPTLAHRSPKGGKTSTR